MPLMHVLSSTVFLFVWVTPAMSEAGSLSDLVKSCRADLEHSDHGYCKGVFEGALTASTQSCLDAMIEAYGKDPSQWKPPFSASNAQTRTGLEKAALQNRVIEDFLKWFDAAAAEKALIGEVAVDLLLSNAAAYSVLKFLSDEYPCEPFVEKPKSSEPKAEAVDPTGWVVAGAKSNDDGMSHIVKRFGDWNSCLDALDTEVTYALNAHQGSYSSELASDAMGQQNQVFLLDRGGNPVALFSCSDDARAPGMMSMIGASEIIKLYHPQ